MPPAAVRIYVPWYLRSALIGLFVLAAAFFAAWGFGVSLRFVEENRAETGQEADQLRERIALLENELRRWRASSSEAASALIVERAVQEQLARQVQNLEEQNSRLKRDLVFFESLEVTQSGAETGPAIRSLEVEADSAPQRYRYRMLVVFLGDRKSERFDGSYELIVTLERDGLRDTISWPGSADEDRKRFKLAFRHFRRVDGVFGVPEGARPVSVEVRLLQGSARKASRMVLM